MHYPDLFESLKPKLKKLNFRLIDKSPRKLKDIVIIKFNTFSYLFCSDVYQIPLIYKDSLKTSNHTELEVRQS